ncbi:MAG: hypothetical protein ACREHF_06550 [Rhizomicrobium sp.]
MTSRISIVAALLAGTALFGAAPSVAQPSTHGFAAHPHASFHRPAPFHSAFRPSFHRVARPGFHSRAVRGAFVRRGFHPLHAAIIGHVGFAHFTPAERAAWVRGRWSHRWWHGRFGWWWDVGGDWFWYGAPVYPYPTVVSDYYDEEPEYAEPGPTWYYCYNPAGYYPYVPSCNGPWQPVPAQGYSQYDQGGPEQGPPPQQYQYGPPPASAGSQDQQEPPPGYDQGPPPGYNGGPYDQGAPPDYGQGPSGYDQGPPPGYDQGPPPGSNQGPNDQQGQK